MMEKFNTEDKLEFWRLVVEEFENSEKSIKEQCQENDIALGQYYHWRKKLRESELDDVGAFIEINKPEDPLINTKASSIILEYGQGFKLKLEEDFNPRTLNSVLKVLMSL